MPLSVRLNVKKLHKCTDFDITVLRPQLLVTQEEPVFNGNMRHAVFGWEGFILFTVVFSPVIGFRLLPAFFFVIFIAFSSVLRVFFFFNVRGSSL